MYTGIGSRVIITKFKYSWFGWKVKKRGCAVNFYYDTAP